MFRSLSPGTLSFSPPLEEALLLASTHGFEGLDLPIAALLALADRTSQQDVRDRYSAAGVRPGGWGLPVDFRGAEEPYRAGMAALPRHAALAQALDNPWCSTWILPFSDTLTYEENMAFHVTRLRPVAELLADHGCRLGLEFVGPLTLRVGHSHKFISTMAEALDLGKRIGTGNVGLLLDCFHWYTSHGTLDDVAHLTADQIVYVHVNDAVPGRTPDEQIDNERMLPGGSGVIDITGFLQALERIGFAGPVAVEPFNAEVKALPPAERVRVTGESLTSVWTKAGIRH